MNILIVGLGAIGSIYATKIYDSGLSFKVLLDEERFERYIRDGIIFNEKRYDFEYLLPKDKFDADLIIIAVKSTSLNEVIPKLKNFITDTTVILSLLNGISSEKEIKNFYSNIKVPYSYYVGHASMRIGNRITYDGIGKIVFEGDKFVEDIFKKAKIPYEIPKDIISSMWQKFIINIGVNQTTAVLKQPYKCFLDEKARNLAKELMEEGVKIAVKVGVSGHKEYVKNAFKFIDSIPGECKTSMQQDVENGIKTEVDIFAGEICRLGKIYGIPTPKNQEVYNLIKNIENNLD